MTFLTAGLAIAGATAMVIPIIIHLLSRQRRKPIEWAAMRFLYEAFRKHRRKLQVQQLLLLLTRCLIVLLLGAALARPVLDGAGIFDAAGGRTVYFVIDNGLVSGVELDGDRTALDQHVQQAVEIIRSLDASDRVGVMTAAQPASVLLSPPSTDHRGVMNMLRAMEPIDSATDFAGAFRSLRRSLDEMDAAGERVFIYVLSEFRAGSAALDSALPGSLRDLEDRITLLAAEPAETTTSNVQVRSIDPVRHVILPGAVDGSEQVTVRVGRQGAVLDRDVTRVRLRCEGLPAIEPRTVNWEPGQTEASVDFRLNVEGMRDRTLTLTAIIDDDALFADNRRSALIETRTKLRIVMLDRRAFGFEPTVDRFSSARWMRRALEPYDGGPVEVVDVEPAAMDVSDLRTAEIVIAPRPDLITDSGWDMLDEFVAEGGIVIVSPPGEMNVHQWIERMTEAMRLSWRIALEVEEHEDGLFLDDSQPRSEVYTLIVGDMEELVRPIVASRSLLVDREQSQVQTLLRFEDDRPLLILGSPSRDEEIHDLAEQAAADAGLVAMFTVALELNWTNLPAKPLMVPMMHELVRQGAGLVRSRQQFTAGAQPSLAGYRTAVELVGPDDASILLDDERRPGEPLTQAGAYAVRDGASQRLGTILVNVDPRAGRTDAQSSSAVMSWLSDTAVPGAWAMLDREDPAAPMRAAAGGSPIAGWILVVLLALVILETLLARWFSHAYRDEQAVTPFAAGAPAGGGA